MRKALCKKDGSKLLEPRKIGEGFKTMSYIEQQVKCRATCHPMVWTRVMGAIIAVSLAATLLLIDSAYAQEDLQAMSDDELAEYFTAKQCAADLYVVCTDRSIMKRTYLDPHIKKNAIAINQELNNELYKEEIARAIDEDGLDPSQAHHGHMIKSCGVFSCSWEYKK